MSKTIPWPDMKVILERTPGPSTPKMKVILERMIECLFLSYCIYGRRGELVRARVRHG